MKKFNLKYAFIAALAFSFAVSANAQSDAPKYQRSSLHMILLTTDEPTVPGAEEFSAKLDQSWQSYPFPEKYNQHTIAYTQGYGGHPKGSLIELINKYQGKLDNLSLNDAKEIMATISEAKVYNQCLVDTINVIINTEKIGNQLIRKWFNIQDDGSYDTNLIRERAEYNATQADIANANATARGLEAIFDEGEDLIANTFVTFSKLAFYPSEPVAAFVRDVAIVIAGFTPGMIGSGMVTAANVAYEATHSGYTARTTTALYRLDWNEDIKGEFYAMFSPDGKTIDMEKFNNHIFTMSLVGIDAANSTTIDVAAGLGVGKEKPEDALVQQTIIRNIDKILAKMQKEYDEFAPVSQIISVNPLVADMGKKEGLEGGETFDLLQGELDSKTNKIVWKSIGVVKVDKKQIWDNRYSLVKSESDDNSGIKGTVLSDNKKAAVGMVVKQQTSKKKK